MKKLLIILMSMLFLLFGCISPNPDTPESIETDTTTNLPEYKTYKTGFYSTMFPNKFEYTDNTFSAQNMELTQIEHKKFYLYHTNTGSYTEGTIYCEESQYDEVSAYYSDPKNYTYHCILGVNSDTTSEKNVSLDDVDISKFDALLEFGENSSYDPFNFLHNSKIDKIELPMPDDNVETRMIFYKESKDSLFTSSKSEEYYIIDNTLYLVYQYDYGHGEYEKLIAVKAPDEISKYFVKYMNTVTKQ